MSRIAVVVPTIRQDMWYDSFYPAWEELFRKHEVLLLKVVDGDDPHIAVIDHAEKVDASQKTERQTHDVFSGEDVEVPLLLRNYSPAIRNFGFAAIAKLYPEVKYIMTLDDDCLPVIGETQDTISQHRLLLDLQVPISWVNTLTFPDFPRGFPYKLRREAQVMLSHGIWHEVADWDAINQIFRTYEECNGKLHAFGFYRGVIPRDVYFPLSGMNVAFRRELLPYAYWAPVADVRGCERFDDIWAGIHIKKACDTNGWACVSGYSAVTHHRASNPMKNLQKEAVGIAVNESYYQAPDTPAADETPEIAEFRTRYYNCRCLWKKFVDGCESQHAVNKEF